MEFYVKHAAHELSLMAEGNSSYLVEIISQSELLEIARGC